MFLEPPARLFTNPSNFFTAINELLKINLQNKQTDFESCRDKIHQHLQLLQQILQ